MTPARYKTAAFRLLYLSIAVTVFAPFYMYFSYDVAKLNKNFPHVVNTVDKVPEFELRPEKPKNWSRLNEISSYAKWAIILSEDWGFYQHEGIDVKQMKVALNEMVEVKRFRGASTITQQMVKNVFLSEDRTLWRKLHEIILAYKVETVLSKSKILETYLNVIEYGPNIYGITQAARHYFNKHPGAINATEAAFLAMLLPSPKKYYVSFKRKKRTAFARARIKAILVKMRMGKILTAEQYEAEKISSMSWEK